MYNDENRNNKIKNPTETHINVEYSKLFKRKVSIY